MNSLIFYAFVLNFADATLISQLSVFNRKIITYHYNKKSDHVFGLLLNRQSLPMVNV